MKRSTRVVAILLSLCVSFALLAGCGGNSSNEADPAANTSGDKIVFKATQCFSATHPWGRGLEYLGQLLEEKSGGTMGVDVYHGNSIGNGDNRTCIEMVMEGTCDIEINSPTVRTGWDERFAVFSLPFLLPNTEVGLEVMNNTEVGKDSWNWVESYGEKAVGIVVNGYRMLTNAVRPIHTPEDISGLKLRVPDSKVHLAVFNALNADPTSLTMSEVYTSIQQGTVDGQENPIPVIASNKLYEVCPYITLWTYMWDPAFVMMHTGSYDKLTDEQKAIFDECMAEACQFIIDAVAEDEAKYVSEFEDYGCEVYTLTDDETEQFKKATAVVYDEFREALGADFIDGFIETVNETSKKMGY